MDGLYLRFGHIRPTITYLIVLLLFVPSIAGAEPASVPIASPEYDEPDYESPVDYCESKCLIKHEGTEYKPSNLIFYFFITKRLCKFKPKPKKL